MSKDHPDSELEARAELSERLVESIVSGDPQERARAEQQLVLAFERGIRRVLRSNLNNPADVDEVTNDVWRTAIPKIRANELRERRKLAGYLNKIARGLARNLNKRFYKKQEIHDDEAMSKHASSPDPTEGQVMHEQEMERAMNAINALSPKYRDVLLTVLRGEEKKAACKRLGLTPIQFNKLYSRAKGMIARILQDPPPTPGPSTNQPSRPIQDSMTEEVSVSEESK